MEKAATKETHRQSQPQKKNNTMLFIAIGVIIILALAGVFALGQYKNSIRQQATSQQTTKANTDTSNQQLDKETQDVETNLKKLDSDIDSSDQQMNNQSADTPSL